MTRQSDSNDASTDGQTPEPVRGRVLYPIFHSESDAALHLAADLAAAMGAELFVGYVDIDGGQRHYESARDTAQVVLETKTDSSIEAPVEGHTVTGSTPLDAVVTAASAYDVDAIVVGEEASERLEAQIARHTGRDTIVVSEQGQLDDVASVLVAVAGGPYSGGAVDVASALANANDARLELLHVRETGDDAATEERAEELLAACRSRISGVEDVESRVVEAADAVDVILAESADFDVTVIGAPRKGRLRRFVFGSTTDEIRAKAPNTVVMVRLGSDPEGSLFGDPITATRSDQR